ncbi:MAG: site-2 protease family protein [Elusimicrobiaceae bacterium]
MDLRELFIQLPVLFFSIVCHEYAHGYTAHKNGDDTAYLMNRLTLNPLPHVDLFGTIIIPVAAYLSHLPMIGWAKPVPVNPLRLDSPRRDMMRVAVSGPAANIMLAVAFALLYKITALLFADSVGQNSLTVLVLSMASYGIVINLMLAFFNLIPVSPLDGSHILAGWLPDRALEKYAAINAYGPWIIMGLLFTGLLNGILKIPVNLALLVFSYAGIFSR